MKTTKKLLSIAFMTIMANSVMASEPIVSISTDYGTIKIKLYEDTPKHQANFIKLTKEGFYNGTLFHRVIKNFMIQGGDPTSKTAKADQQLGSGDIGYTIPAEIKYPEHYHKKGALAAARTGDQVNPKKESSGCQFYIVEGKTYTDNELNQMETQKKNKEIQKKFYALVNQPENTDKIKKLRMAKDQAGLNQLQTQLIEEATTAAETDSATYKMPAKMREDYKKIGGTPFLDGEYTVYGEVIEGMDVIDKIATVDCNTSDRPLTDIKMTVKAE